MINSYEEFMRNKNFNLKLNNKCKNEKEIKLYKIEVNDE